MRSLVFLSPAAALAPPKERLGLPEDFQPTCLKKEPARAEGETQLVVNDETDIALDGKPCKLADIPEGAEIIRLDVAADKQSIRVLHYRSEEIAALG